MVTRLPLHYKHQTRSAMRRIIERKVTVVTTTTWTISWQDDTLHSSPAVDPAQPVVSNTDVLPAAQQASTVIEAKEADFPVAKPTMDEILDDSTFYRSKKGKR